MQLDVLQVAFQDLTNSFYPEQRYVFPDLNSGNVKIGDIQKILVDDEGEFFVSFSFFHIVQKVSNLL